MRFLNHCSILTTFTHCFIAGLLFGALNGTSLQAQSRSYSTLPLVNSAPGRFETNQKIQNTPDYFHALSIYEDLVDSRGDYRLPVPGFSLAESKRKVAFIEYDGPDIIIERKALEVCNEFGEQKDAAIAFLLGHELTHYYEKHCWRRAFVYDFKDLAVATELSQIHDDVYHETEADYLGGFLVYSAGYGMFDRGADLIDKLYKAYGLPDSIPGYPSLTDRKILSKRSAEKMKALADVFDQANLMNAIGNYRAALSLYKFILEEYSSREIYNNMGFSAIHYAMELMHPDSLLFHYSASLDLESSIRSRGSGNDSTIHQLLKQSIVYFDAAISLDPHYAPAYYNKALAYALLKDVAKSRFYAEYEARPRAIGKKFEKLQEDIDILMALLEATNGDKKMAISKLTTLAAMGNQLAKINLELLEKKPKQTLVTRTVSIPHVLNKYNLKQILEDFQKEGSLPFDSLVSYPLNQVQKVYKDSPVNSNLTAFYLDNEATQTGTFFFGEVRTSGTSWKQNIQSELISDLGQPNKTILTPAGQLFLYLEKNKLRGVQNQGMLFEIAKNQTITKKYIFCEFKNL